MKHQYKKWPVFFIFPLLFFLGGCDKKDFTLPVDFTMNFSLNNEPIMGGSITIDEIGIGLRSIDIRGYREQGEDVFLTRDFQQGKTFLISPFSPAVFEEFDIPQGTYDPISFLFKFQPDAEENELIDDVLDWLEDLEEGEDPEELEDDLGEIIEDYLEEVEPCIMVKGKFSYNSKIRPFVIVVNDPLSFNILGENKNGGSDVVLDKNIVNVGKLQLNPSYWFSVITPAMLDNAYIGVIDDVEYIFLSKYVNSQIYAAVYNRMEESTTLTINE